MAANQTEAQRQLGLAQKKLTELGIPCKIVDGGRLIGALPDEGTPIVNPLNSRPLLGIRFDVEGHDHLRLTAPASLAGVPRLEFYSRLSQEELRKFINVQLIRRAETVTAQHNRLRKLGFEMESLDHLGQIRAILDLELVGTAVIEVNQLEARLVECKSVVGGAAVATADLEIDLDQFEDSMDMELFLTSHVEKALRENKPVRTAPVEKPVGKRSKVAVQSATANSLSLAWLLEQLGPEYFAGENLTLSRNLDIDGQPARLDLHFVDRETIAGQIFIEEELRWQGDVTLANLKQLEAFVSRALQEAPKPAAESHVNIGGLIPPLAGEVWVMDVEIDAESPEEVRYVALDAQGGRNGAPRVLARNVFEKVFVAHGIGYRMLIGVVRVTATDVTYQRLHADEQPAAAPRDMPMAIFLATFLAKAAAY